MRNFRKIMSSLLTLSTSLALSGLGMVTTAYGAQLQQASVTMSDVRSGVQSNYAFTFNLASTTDVREVQFQFSNTASGSVVPTGMKTDATASGNVSLSAVAFGGNDFAHWTLDKSTNGLLKVTRDASATVSAGQTVTFTIQNIDNNTTAGTCDAVTDSDSCWVQIRTYSDTPGSAGNLIDQTAITYTVINPITVSATIDPILTFTVSGVNSNSIIATPNDAHVKTGTPTTSTSTSIQFGNVTVGSPKVAQQKLVVVTNANNGYYVYQKFIANAAGSNLMNGSAVHANKIDAFAEGGASWTTPGAWTAPTGTTPGTNTAELGMRTSNYTAVANFNADDVYGPPVDLIGGTGNAVMKSTTSDTGTPAYVTYAIQANAKQPADSYAGVMTYQAVPSY